MVPAAPVREGGEPRDRRFRDDIHRCALPDMPRRALHAVEQMRAAGTRALPLGPEHKAVEKQRVVLSKQL